MQTSHQWWLITYSDDKWKISCAVSELFVVPHHVLVEHPQRLPLLAVQEDVGPLLLHVIHSLLGGPVVGGHEVAAHKGGAPKWKEWASN